MSRNPSCDLHVVAIVVMLSNGKDAAGLPQYSELRRYCGWLASRNYRRLAGRAGTDGLGWAGEAKFGTRGLPRRQRP